MTWPGPYPGSAYVVGPSPACITDGCQLAAARRVLAEARDLNQRMIEERSKMGNAALWCDSGHAFSERDPGRRTITVTATDQEGLEKYETRQFCGGCAPTVDLMAEPRTRPAEFDRPARAGIGGTSGS